MCGIAGVVSRAGTPVTARELAALELALRHRGPDGVGFLQWRNAERALRGRHLDDGDCDVGLVHRRLSILDLSETGWQPMHSPDGTVDMVFNGEIYNYVELREQLAKCGWEFVSTGDAEVLLAAYCQWGTEAFTRLVGMFAVAFLDTARRVVVLARDPFGIKPLFYTAARGRLAFASEVPALLQLPGVSRTANAQSVYDYLRFGYTDGSARCMLGDISQLRAAHHLTVPIDGGPMPSPVRYWTPQLTPLRIGFDDAAAQVRAAFLRNLELHLRSDVAVGAALSGGIDSSAIVTGIRHIADPGLQLHSFSWVTPGHALDEDRWSTLVAQQAGTDARRVHASDHAFAEDGDDLIAAQGEPFGSTSIYAQYCLFRSVHEAGIKVMLDGQGADEILAGYRGYSGARVATLLTRMRLMAALRLLWQAGRLPGTAGRRRLLMHAGRAMLPAPLHRLARRAVGDELVPEWLDAGWLRRAGVRLHAGDLDADPALVSSERLRTALARDVTVTSLPALLRYEDRNSMHFSVESRVPFLTPGLVELVLSLPEEFLISKDGVSKHVFREAMRDIVPDAILDRRDKIGFATPALHWFSTQRRWVEETLADREVAIPPLVREVALRLFTSAGSHKGSLDELSVWRWINLIRWTRIYNVSYPT